jgi:4,5-dihydroxyphthalate decarboxylase
LPAPRHLCSDNRSSRSQFRCALRSLHRLESGHWAGPSARIKERSSILAGSPRFAFLPIAIGALPLDIKVLRPRETFQRMLDNREFQASELSLASYTALKGRGEGPFVAVPAALSRIFRHSCIYVRAGAGIERPADLRGKRVGTSQWSATALVFMRGMLEHDYGVRTQDMHWFMGGLRSFVEPPLIPRDLPENIKLDFLSDQQTLEQMFEAGDLDALLSIYMPKLFVDGSPSIVRLFPNYKEAEQDYYRRTRIFPIMHTVVLREDVYRAHPWAAQSIYSALLRARDLAVDGLYDCRGCSIMSRRRGASSATISGPTASLRTARPTQRSDAICTSRVSRRGW